MHESLIGPEPKLMNTVIAQAYWLIVDYILWTPIIGPFLKPYLPMVGYILMITM